jgi:hypothetical protein
LLSDIKQFALLQWTKLRDEASLACRCWHPNPCSCAAGVADVVSGSVIFGWGPSPEFTSCSPYQTRQRAAAIPTTHVK